LLFLRQHLFAARAGERRRHQSVQPATRELLDSVAAAHLAGSGLPQSLLDALSELLDALSELLDALSESKATHTWDRHAGVIRPWFDHAAELGIPPIPTLAGAFAAWRPGHGIEDTPRPRLAVTPLQRSAIWSGTTPPPSIIE
jgi:hypothetical protein